MKVSFSRPFSSMTFIGATRGILEMPAAEFIFLLVLRPFLYKRYVASAYPLRKSHRSKSFFLLLAWTETVLNELAARMRAQFQKSGVETFVDFSCGNNALGSLLGVPWVGFDIAPPAKFATANRFRMMSWFDVPNDHPSTVRCGV